MGSQKLVACHQFLPFTTNAFLLEKLSKNGAVSRDFCVCHHFLKIIHLERNTKTQEHVDKNEHMSNFNVKDLLIPVVKFVSEVISSHHIKE